jgi:hypothetical protein
MQIPIQLNLKPNVSIYIYIYTLFNSLNVGFSSDLLHQVLCLLIMSENVDS